MGHRPDSDTAYQQLTIPPGGFTSWHTHPGPTFVAVRRGGTLYHGMSGCPSFKYATGAGFMQPSTEVHNRGTRVRRRWSCGPSMPSSGDGKRGDPHRSAAARGVPEHSVVQATSAGAAPGPAPLQRPPPRTAPRPTPREGRVASSPLRSGRTRSGTNTGAAEAHQPVGQPDLFMLDDVITNCTSCVAVQRPRASASRWNQSCRALLVAGVPGWVVVTRGRSRSCSSAVAALAVTLEVVPPISTLARGSR